MVYYYTLELWIQLSVISALEARKCSNFELVLAAWFETVTLMDSNPLSSVVLNSAASFSFSSVSFLC